MININSYECPPGWNNLIKQLCDELEPKLKELNILDTYLVIQAKEKFGELRWYDNCCEQCISDIVDKYVEESKYTCVSCGNLADWETIGYISPICHDCLYTDEIYCSVIPIEEFYHFWDKR